LTTELNNLEKGKKMEVVNHNINAIAASKYAV
jgi:hypothetical protein